MLRYCRYSRALTKRYSHALTIKKKSEDLDESVDSQQAKGEAGRPRVAPPSLGDSDGEPINSDVEDE